MTHPILYSFRRCPYAMRARLAISVSGQTVELREVVLRDKPAALLAISPKATVPVLQLPDGTVIEESSDIMDWALAQHDPEGWLNDDRQEREKIVAFTIQGEGRFKRALDRYKYPSRYEDENIDREEQRGICLDILKELDTQIGDKAFLFGDSPRYSDMAFLPFLRQYAHTDKDWFDDQDIPNVQRWLEAFLVSPRFQGIMVKYDKWEDGAESVLFP